MSVVDRLAWIGCTHVQASYQTSTLESLNEKDNEIGTTRLFSAIPLRWQCRYPFVLEKVDSIRFNSENWDFWSIHVFGPMFALCPISASEGDLELTCNLCNKVSARRRIPRCEESTT